MNCDKIYERLKHSDNSFTAETHFCVFIATNNNIRSSSVSFQDDSLTYSHVPMRYAFFMGCFSTAISWSVLFSILHFHRLLHVCLFICLPILLGSVRIYSCCYNIAYGMWPTELQDYVCVFKRRWWWNEEEEEKDDKEKHRTEQHHTWIEHSIVPSFVYLVKWEMGQRK